MNLQNLQSFAKQIASETGLSLADIFNSSDTVASWFGPKGLTDTQVVDNTNTGTERPVQEGRCYHFDGSNDQINVSSSENMVNSSQAFSFFCRINRDTNSGTQALIAKGGTSERDFIMRGGFDQFRLVLRGSSTMDTGRVNMGFTPGTWGHVGFIVSDNGGGSFTINLYVNGVSVHNSTGTWDLSGGTGQIEIAARLTALEYNGKMYDLRLFDKALSSSEIASVYELTDEVPIDDYLIWYKMDEQDGDTAYNAIGDQNNGKIVNAALDSFHTTDLGVRKSRQNDGGYSLGWFSANSFSDGEIKIIEGSDFVGKTNVTLSFDVRTTDTQAVLLASTDGNGWMFDIHDGSSTQAVISRNTGGSFSLFIDNVQIIGSQTRDEMHSLIATGEWVNVRLEGLDMTNAAYVNNGLHIGGFSSSAWAVTNAAFDNIFFDGNPVTMNRNLFLPRDESDTANDVKGSALDYTGSVPLNLDLANSNAARFDGIDDYLAAPHLAGTETVVSSGGTSTPTVSAGRIDFTEGTCWNIVLSDGTNYPLSEGRGTDIHDVSGNSNHAVATNVTLASFWGTEQDEFHHNITKGATKIDRTPDDIDTVLWLDANDSSTITESSGSVSQWNDKSGNDYHFTQTTGANQPTSNTHTIGGKAAIRFDSNTKNISTPNGSQWRFGHDGSGCSIFMVVNMETVASGLPNLFYTRTSDKGFLIRARDTDRYNVFIRDSANSSIANFTASNVTYDAPTLLSVEHGTARNSDVGIYENGDLSIQNNYTNNPTQDEDPNTGPTIGNGAVFTIGELIMIDRLVEEDERQQIEGYLSNKRGINNNLPETHPYDTLTPRYFVPALDSGDSDALGNTITNPAGNWHNGAETQLTAPLAPSLVIADDTDDFFFDGSGNRKNIGYGDIVENVNDNNITMANVSVEDQKKSMVTFDSARSSSTTPTLEETQEILSHT